METSPITDVSGLAEAAAVKAGQFSFTVDDLDSGTIYFFAVVAVDYAGNADSTITGDPVSGSPVDVVAPEDVTDFKVLERYSDRLVLNWRPSADSATLPDTDSITAVGPKEWLSTRHRKLTLSRI